MSDYAEYKLKDVAKSKETLKTLLKHNILEVTFTKKDGSNRIMLCTLNESQLPLIEVNTEPKRQIKLNEDIIRVYDLEADGWRSFYYESIQDFNFSIERNIAFGIINE